MPEYDSTTEYRDVEGFGHYKIGSDGTVWTCSQRKGWREFKQMVNENGYMTVRLCKSSKYKTFKVHRLVMAAFIGQCPDGEEVRHKDGYRTNNRLGNLQYGTRAENMKDAAEHGTLCCGENHVRSKLTADEVSGIRKALINGEVTITSVANRYGMNKSTVWAIKWRKSWRSIE